MYDQSSFQPKFEWVDDVDTCSDMINRPHEDYPLRVNVTKAEILSLIEHLYPASLKRTDDVPTDMDWALASVNLGVITAIHSQVMGDLSDAGYLRGYPAKVGDTQTAPSVLIPVYLNDILPIKFAEVTNRSFLIEWYRKFQIIHPFSDGNGRVGGIVVAALSNAFLDSSCFLAPHQ